MAVASPLGLQCCVKLHAKHFTDLSWGPEEVKGLFLANYSNPPITSSQTKAYLNPSSTTAVVNSLTMHCFKDLALGKALEVSFLGRSY